jgi:pyrroline-5-carboxylate reductase
MSDTSVGFVGAGRVVRIFLTGWLHAGTMPNRVVLFDTNLAVSAALSALHGAIEVSPDAAGAAGQDVVFLAVHPPAIAEAVATIKASLRPDGLLVSLAPKVTIAGLTGLLGGFDRIARVIPNAPSIAGQGYNPVAFGPSLHSGDRSCIGSLLSNLGEFPEVDEGQLEAYAILSAMAPTYFWPQFYELIALGESFGLTRDGALAAVEKMVLGTVVTMTQSGLSSTEVLDLVPVKPMADDVATLVSAYREKLASLMEKMRP